MTREDFSNQFDTLLNSYAREANPGEAAAKLTVTLDEYEKSVYLTRSQKELVIALYTGKNPFGESFEETEELRRYLAPIVKEAQLSPISTTSGLPLGIDSKSKFFTLPEDLWFITYESVDVSDSKCEDMKTMEVVPVTQDEYHKIKKNPFRGANNRRSLRLDLSDGVVEIVSKFTVSSYYLRYLRKLKPIILIDLPDGMTIENETSASDCKLHEALHHRILDGAVRLALQAWGYNNKNSE